MLSWIKKNFNLFLIGISGFLAFLLQSFIYKNRQLKRDKKELIDIDNTRDRIDEAKNIVLKSNKDRKVAWTKAKRGSDEDRTKDINNNINKYNSKL